MISNVSPSLRRSSMKSSTVGRRRYFVSSRGRQASRPFVYGCLRVARRFRAPGRTRHLAAVHHGHVVGDFGDHAEVVRDEDDRHAAVVAELAEDFENLGLDRDVEGGGRLVGDQQLRVAREGHRDHHALLLPAGHLVRIRIDRAAPGSGMPTSRSSSIVFCRASALLTF